MMTSRRTLNVTNDAAIGGKWRAENDETENHVYAIPSTTLLNRAASEWCSSGLAVVGQT